MEVTASYDNWLNYTIFTIKNNKIVSIWDSEENIKFEVDKLLKWETLIDFIKCISVYSRSFEIDPESSVNEEILQSLIGDIKIPKCKVQVQAHKNKALIYTGLDMCINTIKHYFLICNAFDHIRSKKYDVYDIIIKCSDSRMGPDVSVLREVY
jgi:hypothetical protein